MSPSLPPELLLHIFSFCNPDTWIELSYVSRNWNYLATSLLRKFFLEKCQLTKNKLSEQLSAHVYSFFLDAGYAKNLLESYHNALFLASGQGYSDSIKYKIPSVFQTRCIISPSDETEVSRALFVNGHMTRYYSEMVDLLFGCIEGYACDRFFDSINNLANDVCSHCVVKNPNAWGYSFSCGKSEKLQSPVFSCNVNCSNMLKFKLSRDVFTCNAIEMEYFIDWVKSYHIKSIVYVSFIITQNTQAAELRYNLRRFPPEENSFANQFSYVDILFNKLNKVVKGCIKQSIIRPILEGRDYFRISSSKLPTTFAWENTISPFVDLVRNAETVTYLVPSHPVSDLLISVKFGRS